LQAVHSRLAPIGSIQFTVSADSRRFTASLRRKRLVLV
jgi:hypothetical protein